MGGFHKNNIKENFIFIIFKRKLPDFPLLPGKSFQAVKKVS